MTFKNKQCGFSVIELMFVLAVMAALAGVLLYPKGEQSGSVKQFQQEIHNAVFLARKLSVEHGDVTFAIDESRKKVVISFVGQDSESQKKEFDVTTDGISDCKFYSIVETSRSSFKKNGVPRNEIDYIIIRSKYCQPFELSFEFEKNTYSLFIDRLCQMTSTFPESMLYGQK